MVESDVAPTIGVMARTAIGTELPVMLILRCVAGITIGRRTFIHAIDMACAALNVGMLPRERKTGVAVIETDIRPFDGFMTGTTIHAKLTVVFILCSMTGIAIFWRAFVDIIQMARLTGSIHMRSRQRKGSIAVIECCVLPTGRCMTC